VSASSNDSAVKYEVVYADPPWSYSFSKSDSRKIENQYPTMSTDEICALTVPSADNAVLYLWATAPKLLDALSVMESWGFSYRTHAIWDKQKIGMGFWFRGQHELLLVGVKGEFSPPERSAVVSSVFREPRGLHSRKPEAIRELIAKWFPSAKRLEMFSRPVTGNMFDDSQWDSFGNEVESVELRAVQ
jgi:N6-adenosine-specific RNA methylase IME4